MEVSPDRVGEVDRDGEVVVVDPDGAEEEERASIVCGRLQGGSSKTEDRSSATPCGAEQAGSERLTRKTRSDFDAS